MMKMKTDPELQELRRRRRDLARAMREQGIRRTSFMNGGLSEVEYRANADMFDLETRIRRLEGVKI